MRRFLLFIGLICFAATLRAEVVLEVYWSLKCPHCLEALPQIEAMAKENPWLRVETREITRSPDNLQRFVARAEALGGTAQAVPTLIYCGQMAVGWDDNAAGREALIGRLRACESGEPAPAGVATPSRIALPLLGELDPAALSLPVLTVLLAGLDAFNPCAFFVLLFLLSLLAHQHQRRRMLLIGGVFVSVSGLMYFAFMAAWLNLFLVVGSLPWITAAAGLLALTVAGINIKDFFAFKQGVSLSISERGKAGLFQRVRTLMQADSLPAMLASTVLLAIAANFYELLCTAGFPMVFTRVLTLRENDPATHYLYLALYNLIYVLPLLLIVIGFVRTLGARKLSEREGRLLKLLSGLMMLGLGILLLLMPERLDSPLIAVLLPAAATFITWLGARLTRT
ncbi:thioredoxin family protein [Azonexus sp.]|jgi:thiol-disulfide isomerase/thioredoxin|uniref:TlpA family protein disulfide reductase n=1 Tax=Azonexus sp. TaxID=1872668 RepID=UPI0027B979D1|nr:thioredoxin family protein [Azonexus sp.]